ncbi:Mitochodrial transcription termination factor-related protein [Cynara cardunculus var. scolymus]|uniref:Mitochodrial transcription termination factor-related protein n=2 Tax=Cynara cardunculus var. scolymus TaxID=59895 RepID=A0A103YF09_CYNCS|nr:Mitochodrial transcription termination factor-related protein [Cynara cardunculus var. scolymus]
MMLLRRTILSYPTNRHHSSAAKNLQSLSKIPHRYRAKAIRQAQEALTDYLHAVRTIPYTFAENISKYSIVSLSGAISKVKFSTSDFSKSLQRFFRYHPLNEFELFFESIGIDVNELDGFLPARKFFLSEDLNAFDAACVLYGFGIPWNKLGMLYKEEKTIFDKDPCELKEIWRRYMNCGFTSSSLIGICLVFPHLLSGDSEVEILFNDLKRIVIDFDLISDVEGNVDAWIEICRKIRMFYDLGCRKLDIWEMMGRSKKILVQCPEETLTEKLKYFCRFHVTNEEVTSLLLLGPKIFEFDLKSPLFCVVGLLRHFGLSEEHLNFVIKKYPYVFGRNRLANLPHVMRALNLNQWFFDKIRDGGHNLLTSYAIGSSHEDCDQDFAEDMVTIQSSRVHNHTLSKLEFLHSIGYGENGFTVKVLKHVHGTSRQLQDRFDCLIHNGIEFSKLCKMISLSPKILNQQSEILEKKVEFLCHEIGSSLNYLDIFPAYFCFDLEKRIKPRYRFHMWLMETGLCEREYSLASIVATSEVRFIARIYRIHPAAPKKWLELFMNRDYASFQETS